MTSLGACVRGGRGVLWEGLDVILKGALGLWGRTRADLPYFKQPAVRDRIERMITYYCQSYQFGESVRGEGRP
jgi:hypothetical protein